MYYFWDKYFRYVQGADFYLENLLSGAVELTKNASYDKYKYYVYCIGFDARGSFSLSNIK